VETHDVTCPECGAARGVECRVATWGSIKRDRAHSERVALAGDYRSLQRLGEDLGTEPGEFPDLDEAEYLSRFGDERERGLAKRLLAVAEKLKYREPGDEEGA
jgi:hypothetical protein